MRSLPTCPCAPGEFVEKDEKIAKLVDCVHFRAWKAGEGPKENPFKHEGGCDATWGDDPMYRHSAECYCQKRSRVSSSAFAGYCCEKWLPRYEIVETEPATPIQSEEKWHFGIAVCSDLHRLTASLRKAEIFHILRHDSWSEGTAPLDVYCMYSKFVAWKGDSKWQPVKDSLSDSAFGRGPEPNQIPTLEEVSSERMAQLVQRNEQSLTKLSAWGITIQKAKEANLDTYISYGGTDFGVIANSDLVAALQ